LLRRSHWGQAESKIEQIQGKHVAEAAQNTTRSALDTQKAAAELARMAASLKELIG